MADAGTGGNIIKQLHQLHIELAGYQDELRRGPIRLRASDNLIAKREAAVEAEREKLTDCKKNADQKNLQLKTNEAKILELKGKLNTATSNREFNIIKGQIEADEMANSVLEDEILESLDKVDQAQVECGKFEEEVAVAKAGREKAAAEIAEAKPGLDANVAELEAEIAVVARPLPGEVKEHYTRAIKSFGPEAMAVVTDKICESCHISISPQMQVELNSGKIVICRECSRILYNDD